jgi:DnaJ-class molecular chaperone
MGNPFEKAPGQPEKPKIVTCPQCGGKGHDKDGKTCKRCNGSGKVRDN